MVRSGDCEGIVDFKCVRDHCPFMEDMPMFFIFGYWFHLAVWNNYLLCQWNIQAQKHESTIDPSARLPLDKSMKFCTLSLSNSFPFFFFVNIMYLLFNYQLLEHGLKSVLTVFCQCNGPYMKDVFFERSVHLSKTCPFGFAFMQVDKFKQYLTSDGHKSSM